MSDNTKHHKEMKLQIQATAIHHCEYKALVSDILGSNGL